MSRLRLSESGTTTTPPSGEVSVYAKTDKKVYIKDDTGLETSISIAAAVSSVFTRSGAVVAVAGDYTASQVTNVPAGDIAAVTVQAAINELDTEKLPLSHAGSGGSSHANATGAVAGFLSASDKTKLDGVATGATANSSDAFLLARANHTGTQNVSTIDGTATGELSGTFPSPSLLNSAVIAKVLTGLTYSLGVVASTDSILAAIAKLSSSQTLVERVVSLDISVPDGYIWVRPSDSVFSGTIEVSLLGDSELRFI